LRIISTVIILLISFFCITTYGVLLLPPVQNYVCDIVEKELDSFLKGDVRIGRIRSNLLSRLDIYDLKVMDKSGRDDSVSIEHIRIRYNILALLNRTVHVVSVFGKGINASISVTNNGEMKIPVYPDFTLVDLHRKKKQPEDRKNAGIFSKRESPWKAVIGNVRLNDVNAVYRDSCLHFMGSVNGARIRARFPEIDSIKLELMVPQAEFSSNWWNGTLDTIGGSAILRFNQLNLLESYVKGSGTEVSGWGTIPFNMKESWDLHATVSTEMAPVLAIHGYVPAFKPQGRLWAEVSWQGTLENPILKYRTSGSGLNYYSVDIDSFFLQGGYVNDFVASTKGEIISQLGRIRLDAGIQIPRLMKKPSFGNYQANVSIDQARLTLLNEKLDLDEKKIPGERAIAKGKIRGTGFKRLPDYVTLRVEAEDKLFDRDTLKLYAELNNRQWVIDGELGRDFIEGNGRIQSNLVVHGKVAGQITDAAFLSQYFLKERIDGSVKFESSIDGLIGKPFIHCSIDSRNLRWRSVRSDAFSTVIQYDGSELNIGNLQARISTNLDTLADFFKIEGISGAMTAAVKATGAISSLDIFALVSGKEINYKGYKADSLSAEVSIGAYDRISWNNGYVKLEGTEVKTHGEFSLSSMQTDVSLSLQTQDSGKKKRAGEINIAGLLGKDSVQSGFKISKLDITAISPWFSFGKDYRGALDASGNFKGNWKALEGKVGARLDKPGFKVHRIASIDCILGLADSLLTVKSEIFLKDSSSLLHLNASLPLLPSRGWAIDMMGSEVARVDLLGTGVSLDGIAFILDSSSIANGIGDVMLNMHSDQGVWVLGGTVKIGEGVYRNRKKRISINKLRLMTKLSGTVSDPLLEYSVFCGSARVQRGRADSLYFKGYSTIDTLKVTSSKFWFPNNGTVEVNAIVPLKNMDSLMIQPGFGIDFNINKFPLVHISPFLMDNTIRSGVVDGKGVIRITGGRPVLSGNIKMEDGRFAFEEMSPDIGPVDAQLVMRGDSVIVNKLNGKCGKGKIRGDGFIIWSSSGLEQMKIDITGNNVLLDFRDLAAIRVQNGNIRFSNKDDGGFLVKGSIDLGDTRVVRDLRIADLLEQVQRSNISVQKDPFLQKLSIMVEVKLLDNLTVDINLGDLKMGGEVSITGTAAKPSYTGEIRVNEGYINYFDRKFEITRGNFYNYDPYKLDPLLDLEAVTEIDMISPAAKGQIQTIESDTIYLTIQGRMSEPEVRLWAKQMPLDEGNIISILTLGQPLGAVGGDLGDRLKIFAQQSLIGLGTRKLEQLLGIEKIDFKGNLFDFDSEHSPTLSLTKRFSPRFLLSYETALGDLTKPKVSAMLRLTKHFFVEGQTSIDNHGLDLLFKYSR